MRSNQIQIDAAAKLRAAAAESRREEHIAALELERQGYVARGVDDRVKQVDAQIALAKKSKPEVADEPADTGAAVQAAEISAEQAEAAEAALAGGPNPPPAAKQATPKTGTAKPAKK